MFPFLMRYKNEEPALIEMIAIRDQTWVYHFASKEPTYGVASTR